MNAKIKSIVKSSFFQELFPTLKVIKANTRTIQFSNNSSINFIVSGSNAIGDGFHFVFFDDFMNPNDLNSEAKMSTAETHLVAFLGRKEYVPRTKSIIVEQRISTDDTTAKFVNLLNKGNIKYNHIVLPYEITSDISIFNIDFYQGEFIDKKFDEADKHQLRTLRGEVIWQTQYQQNPISKKGTYIKEEYIMKYNGTKYQEIIFKEIFMTCDLAVKTGEKNDYTVVVLFGIMPNGRLFVIDILRGKWDTDRTKQIVNFWFSWQNRIKHVNSPVIHIEDAAGGHDLANHLKMYYKIPVRLITRTKDLETRIEAVMGFIESKTLWMPYNLAHFNKPDLMNEVYHEITSFVRLENKRDRRTGHDDVLSCIIDGLQYYKDKYYKIHMEYVGMNTSVDE
jgi:predicted phage terminase large subunit-like protein